MITSYMVDDNNINIVGIGKLMIDTSQQNWNIPTLHFLVCSKNETFESVCLEFGFVATGSKQEESIQRLIEMSLFYINAVMTEGRGYEEFKEISINGFMNNYWNIYRNVEFCLAEHKQDLSHEIENRITKAIKKMFDEKVKEIITELAKEAAIKEYEKLSAFTVNSIKYSSLESLAA